MTDTVITHRLGQMAATLADYHTAIGLRFAAVGVNRRSSFEITEAVEEEYNAALAFEHASALLHHALLGTLARPLARVAFEKEVSRALYAGASAHDGDCSIFRLAVSHGGTERLICAPAVSEADFTSYRNIASVSSRNFELDQIKRRLAWAAYLRFCAEHYALVAPEARVVGICCACGEPTTNRDLQNHKTVCSACALARGEQVV